MKSQQSFPRSLGWLGGLAALACISCDSETVTEGIDEPIRVRAGQFFEGALPGTPPLTAEEIANGATPTTPTVTSVDGAGGVLRRGDPTRTIRGRVSGDAYAVALRFPKLGSGYWLAPASAPDPANAGEYTFSLSAELSRALPPGEHELLFAAIGENGLAGTQRSVGLCVTPPYPDNLNACDPRREPPSLVVSLAWDVNADVDLQVYTPDGVLVDAKHLTTDQEASAKPSANAGVLDHDSNGSCVIDGVRRENLVFERTPAPGTYYVYANLFDPCGQTATHFALSLYSALAADEPNTFRQVETHRSSGVLLPVQANGGKSIGLLVTKFVVN